MEAARTCSRRIAEQWGRQIKRQLGLTVECASLRMLAEIQRKLLKVESVLNDENGNHPTPFDFKGTKNSLIITITFKKKKIRFYV